MRRNKNSQRPNFGYSLFDPFEDMLVWDPRSDGAILGPDNTSYNENGEEIAPNTHDNDDQHSPHHTTTFEPSTPRSHATPKAPSPQTPAPDHQTPAPAPQTSGERGPGGPHNMTSLEMLQQQFPDMNVPDDLSSGHFAGLPAMRIPQLRKPNNKNAWVKTPRNVEALLAHIAGDEIDLGQECDVCSKNNGPFKGCVFVPGHFGGACANCRVHERGRLCNYHQNYGVATPRKLKQDEAEITPGSVQESEAASSVVQSPATPSQSNQGERVLQQPAAPTPVHDRVGALRPGGSPKTPSRGTKRTTATGSPHREFTPEVQRRPASPVTPVRNPAPAQAPTAPAWTSTPAQSYSGVGTGYDNIYGGHPNAYERGLAEMRSRNFAPPPGYVEDEAEARPPPRAGPSSTPAFAPAPAGPADSDNAVLPRSNRGNKIEIKNAMKRAREGKK